MNDTKIYLIYQGHGFLIGVPARDLTYEEATQFDIKTLVNSGLYKRSDLVDVAAEKEETKTKKQTKDGE